MDKYLLNNVKQINKYESYYKKEFNIEKIKQDIKDKKLEINLLDLSRFRVFLDSCVILFNKEKFEKYYFKNSYNFKNYISNIKEKYTDTIEFIEETYKIKVEDTFYYEFDEAESKFKPKSLWDSRKILRNAFAHMQYGDFTQAKPEDIIRCYVIFNKDKGIMKSKGLVIEPLCHELIERFFLNQMTKSIAYKHTYIDIDLSLNEYKFVEVRYKGDQKYDGNVTSHPMNNRVLGTGDVIKIKEFLDNNVRIFDITYYEINDSDLNKYKDTLKIYLGRDITYGELGYFIKIVYDIETEFSNFLTHIIQLNDRLIDYKMNLDLERIDSIEDIFRSIEELKEDVDSWIEFTWFFNILKIINFSLRLEESDLEPVKYSDICIDNFLYEDKKMVEFINKKILDNIIKKDEEKFGDIIYILSKIRNSIAHGRIKFEVADNNKVYCVFEDKYYERSEQIKIAVEDLEVFSDNISMLIT